jgi:hypothetical protein
MAVRRGSAGEMGGGARRAGAEGAGWSGAAGAPGREARVAELGAGRRSGTDEQMAGRMRAGAGEAGVESSIPWYSRSRGGNPSTGTAVSRPPVGSGGGGGGGGNPDYPYYPYYPGYPGYGYGNFNPWNPYYGCYYGYGYGCYSWGYGAFGLGYFFYDPFGWNYWDSYGGGYGGGYGGAGYGTPAAGGIRLKVKPSGASVYVDGYYAGTVDDFDNAFQKLSLAIGEHRIEISAPGYKPLVVDITIRDFETINYEGRLEPIR